MKARHVFWFTTVTSVCSIWAADSDELPKADGTASYLLNNSFSYENKPVMIYVSHLTAVTGPDQDLVPKKKLYLATTWDKSSRAGGAIRVALPTDTSIVNYYGHRAEVRGARFRQQVETRELYGIMRQVMEEEKEKEAQGEPPVQPAAAPIADPPSRLTPGGVLARSHKRTADTRQAHEDAPVNPFRTAHAQSAERPQEGKPGQPEKKLVPTGEWYIEYTDKKPPPGKF